MSVVSLHPATTYHFRIVAENGVGLSKPSDPVTIITSEEGKYFYTLFSVISNKLIVMQLLVESQLTFTLILLMKIL